MSTSAPNSPRFQVWVRRQSQPDGPFSIRFEVADGKGILRVARPGVLIDPPARPTGLEERLTGPQLRASRFLHVWDGGRGRQGHSLTRLEEMALDRVPIGLWVCLIPSEDSALHYLFLPDIAPEVEVEEEVGDEPTSPARMLANLREDLSAVGAFEEPIEAGSATDEVPLAALAAEDDEPAVARPRISHYAPPEPIRPLVLAADAPVIHLEPPPEDDAMAPATPLVRHLRRQVGRQNARIFELEEEVRRLRATIANG